VTPAPVVAAQLTRRLTVLGATSTLVGLGLTAAPSARAFGLQTAAWGVVDLAIAGVGAARSSTPPTARRLRTVLLVNAALDVGYLAVGTQLAVRRPGFGGRLGPAAARGHGTAVVVQGLALLVLDLAHARRISPAAPAAGEPRR
jgi:hypothetical protein